MEMMAALWSDSDERNHHSQRLRHISCTELASQSCLKCIFLDGHVFHLESGCRKRGKTEEEEEGSIDIHLLLDSSTDE